MAQAWPRWSSWVALPASHKRLLAMAWLCMPMFWLGLRLFGLHRLMRWLMRQPLKTSSAEPGLDELQALGRVVNAASLFPPWPRACLARSLLLLWILRRRGTEAQLQIGVRLRAGGLDAHAWVAWQGVPVNDRADIAETYVPMGGEVPLAAFRSV